ncbi:MAG: molybdopterin-dependent oxidoreductase [Desulfobacterales bacterium]|jgi:anaerobic selenocysteine-containing dehydrogenase
MMSESKEKAISQITACTMDCPDACSIVVTQADDGSVKLKGNPENPLTSGFTCAKIKDHVRRLQSPDRITHPQLRTKSGWKATSWDEALDLCAAKIQNLRSRPTAILHIHNEGAKGVLKEATTLLFSRLGTSRVRGSLCDAAGYMACVHDFGSRENNDVTDLIHASKIVNWGKDLSRSTVHTAALVKKARKNGTRVLTISPGGDGSQTFSDFHIRIRPGTDRFLAAVVLHLMVDNDLISENILAHTRNPEKFLALVMGHSMDQLRAVCDVSDSDIQQLYSWYADEKPVATMIGAGLQRYRYGGENVRFINALAMLSGNIGRSGGGSYFQLHSYRNLNLSWTRESEKLPRRSFQFPVIGREILTAESPPIEMLWVNGTNVVNQAPDSQQMMQAFDRVDFKVVVDAFMNDTAQCADLVLPTMLFMEQEDVIGSYLHEQVQYVCPVLAAPGEARNDYWILRQIGRRLDPPVDLPASEDCMRASLDSPYLSTTLEEIRTCGCIRSNRPEIAYADLHFDHQDGKYRFPYLLHGEPQPPAEYPLRLLTLVRRKALHSQMLPEDQKQPPTVWVANDSPCLNDLNLEEPVAMVSPLGRLKVSVQTLPDLHPDAVIYRRGDWISRGGGVNQLIAAQLTDIGSGAAYYDQYVRLENT